MLAGTLKQRNLKKFDAGMPAESEDFMFNRLINRFGSFKVFVVTVAVILIFTIILVIAACLQNTDTGENTNTEISDVEDTGENAETDDSGDEASENSDSSNEDEGVVSGINVFFNGTSVKTYADKETALENYISLSEFSSSREVEILAVIGYGQEVSRVRVWTENESGGSNGDEYFLWEDNDWTDTMDLSMYDGTIIVAVSTADYSTPPNNTYEYFSVRLDVSSADSDSESNETSNVSISEATVESNGVSNPQMFVNSVAVTGYSSIEEAIANPMVVSSKEFTLSAGSVNEEITAISVQCGNSSGKSAGISCNQLTGDNNWNQTVNASNYEENILVLYLESSIGFGGNSVGQFIAVQFQE